MTEGFSAGESYSDVVGFVVADLWGVHLVESDKLCATADLHKVMGAEHCSGAGWDKTARACALAQSGGERLGRAGEARSCGGKSGEDGIQSELGKLGCLPPGQHRATECTPHL